MLLGKCQYIRKIKIFAGGKIMGALQFYIELVDSEPRVWRRILVPIESSLHKLHLAFQGAMGWENSHLYLFSESGFDSKLQYTYPLDDSDQVPTIVQKDARRVLVKKVFNQSQSRLQYIYDYGDYWTHHVLFEKYVDEEIGCPICIEGGGACPPEDCGGIRGYQHMREIFKLPEHPEQEEYRQWLGLEKGENWDEKRFNLRETNRRLCLLE